MLLELTKDLDTYRLALGHIGFAITYSIGQCCVSCNYELCIGTDRSG